LGLLAITAAGGVVGALPLLLSAAYGAAGSGPVGGGPLPHLYGGVLLGIPIGTGMCGPQHCSPWQLWWGVAYPVAPLLAAVGAARALPWRDIRTLFSPVPAPDVSSSIAGAHEDAPGAGRSADRDELGQRVARFGLVVAAALTIFAFARSHAAAETAIESS